MQLRNDFTLYLCRLTTIVRSHALYHKPENILVDRNFCKVADFGLAREISRVGNDITYYVSTRWYRAPEVILHCPSYGKPIDIFATGLILAELHSLRPLLPGLSEIDQISKMVKLLGPPTKDTWEEGVIKMKRLNVSLPDDEPMQDIEAIRRTLPRNTSNREGEILHSKYP